MGQKVMAFGPDCRYIIADFIGPRFITDAGIGFRIDQITHWQPLPEPPGADGT